MADNVSLFDVTIRRVKVKVLGDDALLKKR